MEQLIQQSGDHFINRAGTSASLLALSDEEDDDEVISQTAPAPGPSTLVMPSQRVVEHPLPSLLSLPRPTSTTPASQTSSRTSRLPSHNEADSEKKFDAFIRLRVAGGETQVLRVSEPGALDQLRQAQRTRHEARALLPTAAEQVLPHAAVSGAPESAPTSLPRAAQSDQAEAAERHPAPLRQAAAERDDRAALDRRPTAAETVRQGPGPDLLLQAAAAELNSPATRLDALPQPPPADPQAVVPAQADPQAVVPDLPPPAAQPTPDAVGPSFDDDDGGDNEAEPAQERPQLSRRKKQSEAGSFPTRFSPRKSGQGHKYADTYYY